MTTSWQPENRLGPKACSYKLGALADALYAIGGKWKLRIIISLIGTTSRFNDLQRTVTGISSKVLAAELRELELNGFVKRTIKDGFPVIVEYELTEYSITLQPVLDSLVDWGAKHRQKIMNSELSKI